MNSEIFYLIVYPHGNHDKLAVAQCQEFDRNHYSIAYYQDFTNPADANRKARRLATLHGLGFNPYEPEKNALPLLEQRAYEREINEAMDAGPNYSGMCVKCQGSL